MSEQIKLAEGIAGSVELICGPFAGPRTRRKILEKVLTEVTHEPMVQAILDANVTKLLREETLKIRQETERRWKEGK